MQESLLMFNLCDFLINYHDQAIMELFLIQLISQQRYFLINLIQKDPYISILQEHQHYFILITFLQFLINYSINMEHDTIILEELFHKQLILKLQYNHYYHKCMDYDNIHILVFILIDMLYIWLWIKFRLSFKDYYIIHQPKLLEPKLLTPKDSNILYVLHYLLILDHVPILLELLFQLLLITLQQFVLYYSLIMIYGDFIYMELQKVKLITFMVYYLPHHQISIRLTFLMTFYQKNIILFNHYCYK